MYDELGPVYSTLPDRREQWAMHRLHCLKCAHEFIRIIPAGFAHDNEICTFCGSRESIDMDDDDDYVDETVEH